MQIDYPLDGFFDEVFSAPHHPRPHYQSLIRRLGELTERDLNQRELLRDESFRMLGITFTLGSDLERPFPMDLFPRVIPAREWTRLEQGLIQRVRALNAFIDDVYNERHALHDGIVPWSLVLSCKGYRRQMCGYSPPGGVWAHVAGIDLVRDINGEYRVLEDNLRVPSGVSYVLENRGAMSRVFPRLFTDGYKVRPVDVYPTALRRALGSVSTRGRTDPVVVSLTPGIYNSAYFEHVFLARQMGIELVEGRDLVVLDHSVFMHTTHGLQRVDVIYRRIDDDFLDPVAFRPDSVLGVPGLLSAIRAGNVTVANAIGTGVADDKAIYAFIPDLIKYYLGEKPIIKNVPTYLLEDPSQREHVLARLDQLVVKAVGEAGGYGMLIGPKASDKDIADFRRKIVADPRNYIAQEVVQLSRAPVYNGGRVYPAHIDLRPFVVTGSQGSFVLPGGLTRVALVEGSLVVNSSQGGGSKDTWVLERSNVSTATPSRPTVLEPAGRGRS
ncbi:MAG: circularly permuted type 2 ATP-grasp protein [Proteobacteria bacterium]|nr:circularly permuted type 2 ATP-grasp protein [Pseudomonadota bacterium]